MGVKGAKKNIEKVDFFENGPSNFDDKKYVMVLNNRMLEKKCNYFLKLSNKKNL